jgi:hypothetical protein
MRAARIGQAVRSACVLTVLLASTLSCAHAAPAMGASEAEIMPARIVFGAFVRGRTTRLDQLTVYNVTGGGTATLDFGTVHVTRAVPASGIVNLTGFATRHRFAPGQELSVSVVQNGAAGPTMRKITYTFRAGARPLHETVCTSPDPVIKGCVSPCPTPAGALRDYCAGADKTLAFTLAQIDYDHPGPGPSVRLFHLRLVGRIPAKAVIAVFCHGPSCPITVRFYPKPHARLDVAKPFRGRVLRPGTTIELRIFRANAIGQVKRFTVTAGGRVTLRKLCLYPDRVGAHSCGS